MFTIRKVSKMATKCYPSSDFTPAEAFFKILVETAIKRETITYGELVAESKVVKPITKDAPRCYIGNSSFFARLNNIFSNSSQVSKDIKRCVLLSNAFLKIVNVYIIQKNRLEF